MRKINKGEPFEEFARFVNQNKPTIWEDILHMTYDLRYYMLLYEQDCLCGYSEIPLEAENTSSHIDHFVKRDIDSRKTFDWSNLIVSTIDEDFGGKYKDNTYRIKAYEYQQIFNPVVDDMSQFVGYLGDGKMIPSEGLSDEITNKVKKTIEVFNLNCTSIKNRRKDILLQLNLCKDVPKEEIRKAFASVGFTSVLDWFLKVI